MLVDPSTGKPTRIGRKLNGEAGLLDIQKNQERRLNNDVYT